MENYFEIKHKPLGLRVIAVLTAFIAGLSIMGNYTFAAKAEDKIYKDSMTQEDSGDMPEFSLDEPEYNNDECPEATASFVPLTEEENAEIEALRLSALKNIKVNAGETGFVYDYQHNVDIAASSLKHFLYQYSFTRPEPYECDNRNYIERSDNFTSKGVLTINTEHIINAGRIEVRVPINLFQYRNGSYCEIGSIAVSKFTNIPRKEENGTYNIDDIEAYHKPSANVPFNYYFDEETKEYVFVNYGALHSGATDIQIGYSKVDVFNASDNTEWEITPKCSIFFDIEKSGVLMKDGNKIGGSSAYFTECDYDGGKIYMLGGEADEAGNQLVAYYDIDGKPLFVWKKYKETGTEEWYDVSDMVGFDKAMHLIDGKSPIDYVPEINKCYDEILIERDVETPLRGKIDTKATLNSVSKSPEPDNSSGYGSQLYSIGQMRKYINVDNLPSEVKASGGKLNENYIYTCWRVYAKGDCTQPWSMLLEEHPQKASFEAGTNTVVKDENGVVYTPANGAIILGVSTMLNTSYSKRTDHKVSEVGSEDIRRLKSYVPADQLTDKNNFWYVADTNPELKGSFGLQYVNKDHLYNIGFYVVVAYPKSELTEYENDNIKHYPPLKNEVTIHLYPRDNIDEYTHISADTSEDIIYKKFSWKGGDEYWHTYKRVDDECKNGLISVYDKLAPSDDYIGDIWFHESYRGSAYSWCHNLDTFAHVDGEYYKVVNTDDVLTAQPYGEVLEGGTLKTLYGKPLVLGEKDYFYSKAVITVSEFEVDPFEDEVYTLDEEAIKEPILKDHTDKINRDWVFYGWYEGESDWKEIDLTKFGYKHAHFTLSDYVEMKKTGGLAYLTLNFKDRGLPCPYRMKVEHNSIGYNTRFNLDLETQLKLDSPNLYRRGPLKEGNRFYYEDGTEYAGGGDFETFRISLRNYSATKAAAYTASINGSGDLVEHKESELIDNFNDESGRYHNIEGWKDRTLVNGNRFLFLGMNKFYDDGPEHIHCDKDPIDKTDLGGKVLADFNEFLPLKYINGSEPSAANFTEVNRHVYRDHAAIDISILESDAHADKYATFENDTQNGQVMMTYTLTGYEGYKLSKELRPYMEELDDIAVPQRKKVVLCDLLPVGVNYYGNEEPIVGKLTTTQVGAPEAERVSVDDVDDYISTWDKNASKISLDSIDIQENWEGTGRTLVSFTVTFVDDKAVLSDSNWFIGCGIRFKAYVSWDNYGAAREFDNIFAYNVHESDIYNSGNIYGRYTGDGVSQVYDGAGVHIPDTSSLATTVDYEPFLNKKFDNTKQTIAYHNRMYGHANEMESVAMARSLGIKKKVRADKNIYAEYENQTSVVENEGYKYKIQIDKTSEGEVRDVVIFDQIEKIGWEHEGNYGTFKGVDLSELLICNPDLTLTNESGKKPVTIWYSKDRLAPTILYDLHNAPFVFRPQEGSLESRMALGDTKFASEGIKRIEWNFDTVNDLIATNCSNGTWDESHPGADDFENYKWTRSTDYTGNLADVKSIAIDFGDKLFNDDATLNIYVNMTAPDIDPAVDPHFALNEASYYFYDIDIDNYEYSKSEIIVVSFGEERKLDVIKRVVGKLPSEINDSFTFKISSNIKLDEGVYDDFNYSNIQYKLYKKGEDVDDKLLHATSIDGEFDLRDGEKASFASIPVVASDKPGASFDFDNFTITEKSAPFLLGVDVFEESGTDTKKRTVTFTNYYRPVIYLNKKIKGVPEGCTPNNKTFSYKIKIYDTKGADPNEPISFAEGSEYKLLNKVNEKDTVRVDNKLYWYDVLSSAGWYEIPNGWKIGNDIAGLHKNADNTYGAVFDDTGRSFTVSFDADKTVAVPIYIQHIESGNDVGMLYEDENGELQARYRIVMEEVADSEWFCSSPKGGKHEGYLGTGENSYVWTNSYMYKELLVKKIVTHAPENAVLRSTPFKFKLTDKNGNAYNANERGTVQWHICTIDPQGKVTELTGAGTSGTVDTDGTFTVAGCGNADDSIGDAYAIKLSYVKLDTDGKTAKYTVTELLDENGDYKAVKGSQTVEVRGSSVFANVNIENDYLKRDITVNKVVAAKTMPSSSYKFTMVLCPENVEGALTNKTVTVVDKNGNRSTITATVTDTPAKGWRFQLSEGDSATFSEIGKVDDRYLLYEAVDSTYMPLSMGFEVDAAYTKPEKITLEADDDSEIDVINGGEGYVVLRKQFKGSDIGDISSTLDAEDVTVKLELRKTNGDYIDTLSVNNNEITVSGASGSVSNINAITFDRRDNVIINMNALNELAGGQLDGTFRVTETSYNEKIYDDVNRSWYVIEPDMADAVWEYGADTKQGVILNNVTKYSADNVIYKRIGFNDKDASSPTGDISFTIKDKDGKPVQGVKCAVAIFSQNAEVFTNYTTVSDENGIFSIDFTAPAVSNNGWTGSDANRKYFLKLYFDRAVKINPSSPTVLSITENTIATDKSWGAPAGFEVFGDTDTYVNQELLEGKTLIQWTRADADTFVNAQDTEQVAFTKEVTAFSEGDEDTLFKFTVSELVGSGYQPAPHISYKVYDKDDDIATATPKRTGITDLDENDENTGWGIFTLKSGEKAVLELPKNAYWQVSEDNTGKYKLVTDENGDITKDNIDDSALYADSVSKTDYASEYIAQGFEFHTTLDMSSKLPMGYGVVLIDGFADASEYMFAMYDESHDSYDMAQDNTTEISRTARLKGGQSESDAYYYNGLSIKAHDTRSYGHQNTSKKYILGHSDSELEEVSNVVKIYDSDDNLMWEKGVGTSSMYLPKTYGKKITLPDTVFTEDAYGNKSEHRIVGIGKQAYSDTSNLVEIHIPKYVRKIGDNAFNTASGLEKVTWDAEPQIKVIGYAAFDSTSVDVILPDSVETIEYGAFLTYKGGAGNRNKETQNLVIPSQLRYFPGRDDGTVSGTLGDRDHFYNKHMTLRIGEGKIPDMKTSFSYITNNNNTNKAQVGYFAVNSYNQSQLYYSTIIIGQNTEKGVTITTDFYNQLFQPGTGDGTGKYGGTVIVFPKGKLTLEENCLHQRHSLIPNCLRIFQTEEDDIDQLNVAENVAWDTHTIPIYVFTNLTRNQINDSAHLKEVIEHLRSGYGTSAKVYAKDELNAEVISEIINAVNAQTVWDDEVKELLYEAAGIPVPSPLPAPRHLAAPDNIIAKLNDIYLEKKKELLD